MQQFIGCDQHKTYSVFVAMNEAGQVGEAIRIHHDRAEVREFLARLPAGMEIALETSGHYYWLVDEMERAGHHPRLAHALEVQKRTGKKSKKTDQEDAQGLAMLLRNGTLPEVWIPPAALRDQREMLRMRMFLSQQRTRVKNRIHGALARYNVRLGGDPYGKEWRAQLQARLPELPDHTRQSVQWQMRTLNFVQAQMKQAEGRLSEVLSTMPEADLLKTLPAVGPILSMVLTLEIGKVERFASAAHLASYCGLAPRVRSSGGRTHLGQVCGDVNRYLKWAFVEAANLIVAQPKKWKGSHVLRLYRRIRQKKNHPKAAVAVARHLAEAAYWILKKQEVYQAPQFPKRNADRSFVDARVSAKQS
jgi:transposase